MKSKKSRSRSEHPHGKNRKHKKPQKRDVEEIHDKLYAQDNHKTLTPGTVDIETQPMDQSDGAPDYDHDHDDDLHDPELEHIILEDTSRSSLALDESLSDEFDEGRLEVMQHQFLDASSRSVFQRPRGDGETLDSTRSLYDSDVVYVMENGRRYTGDYYMPNDEDEQYRLRMVDQTYLFIFKRQLTSVPLENPSRILDIGCGTGEWAISMAECYPDAEVIGTDIAKIQPTAVPQNVFFEIDDAEEEGGWTWPHRYFDLVHFRNMTGAFSDWSHVYREAYKHLKPGGWIEVIDYDDHKNFLTYFTDPVMDKFAADLAESSRRAGRPRTSKHTELEYLAACGFVDIDVQEHDLPLGPWPKNKEARSAGKFFLMAHVVGLEAVAMRLLTKYMDWTPEEVRELCKRVEENVLSVALDQQAEGFSFRVRVATARRPKDDHDGSDESDEHGPYAYDSEDPEDSEDEREREQLRGLETRQQDSDGDHLMSDDDEVISAN